MYLINRRMMLRLHTRNLACFGLLVFFAAFVRPVKHCHCKNDLIRAAVHHAFVHRAPCACARCTTRVVQLIICFRVARLYFSARVVIRADARRRGAATCAYIPHLAQLRHRSARAEHELPRRDALDAATMKLPENQSNARARPALGRRSVSARSKTPQPYRAQASTATAT